MKIQHTSKEIMKENSRKNTKKIFLKSHCNKKNWNYILKEHTTSRHFLSKRSVFIFKDIYKLNTKAWKKIYHVNIKQKKAAVATSECIITITTPLLCTKNVSWASYTEFKFLVASLKNKTGKINFNNVIYILHLFPLQNAHGKYNLCHLHQCNALLDPVLSKSNLHHCMIHVKFKFSPVLLS